MQNIKYKTIATLQEKFTKKFPNSEIKFLSFLPNRRVRLRDKYGICICDIDTILWYGSTTIKSAENKTLYYISMAKERYNDKFDYSLVNYINSVTKIKIICKLHGIIEQLPYSHLQNGSCYKCGKLSFTKKRIKPENIYIEQIKVIHNDNYVIKKGSYKGTGIKIPHFCKIHKEWFDMRPAHVLEGQMCRKCANKLISIRAKEVSIGWSYSKWEKQGEKSKFFDGYKLYIIKCTNKETQEIFFKIGKTFQKLSRRFQSKREIPYNWEIIKIIEDTAYNISNLEEKLKKLNKMNKYLPKLDFSGKYECYSKIEKYA